MCKQYTPTEQTSVFAEAKTQFPTIKSRDTDPGNGSNYSRNIKIGGYPGGWVTVISESPTGGVEASFNISAKAAEEMAYALLRKIGKLPSPEPVRLFESENGDLVEVTFSESMPIGGSSPGNDAGYPVYNWLVKTGDTHQSTLSDLNHVERVVMPVVRFDQMVGALARMSVDVLLGVENVRAL